MKKFLACVFIVVVAVSCRISYGFRGTSIDYSIYKTIDIRDFQNQASLVYPPLAQTFNEHLKDVFTRNTRLQLVNNQVANMELEGEITRYDLTPMAVQDNALAAQTRLTMAVRIRFIDNINSANDREETFSAYRDFDSSEMLDAVQDELIEQLNKDIVDQIFNATMSNW